MGCLHTCVYSCWFYNTESLRQTTNHLEYTLLSSCRFFISFDCICICLTIKLWEVKKKKEKRKEQNIPCIKCAAVFKAEARIHGDLWNKKTGKPEQSNSSVSTLPAVCSFFSEATNWSKPWKKSEHKLVNFRGRNLQQSLNLEPKARINEFRIIDQEIRDKRDRFKRWNGLTEYPTVSAQPDQIQVHYRNWKYKKKKNFNILHQTRRKKNTLNNASSRNT